MAEISDKVLDACRKGDRKAQKELFDALSAKMFAVCLRYMGNREDARDVFQDGFVTLFSKLDSYSAEGSFEGWARKIFANTALMSLRKKDALKGSEDIDNVRSLESGGGGQLADVSLHELLLLVAGLPANYRTVFNMAVMDGFSHRQIAAALGIPEATSRSQLLRARLMLQEKIRKKNGEKG